MKQIMSELVEGTTQQAGLIRKRQGIIDQVVVMHNKEVKSACFLT